MMLKVQTVFDATQVLATIINENRHMPTKGKYRVARMHAKLFPEFTTANDQRSEKILSYEHRNEADQPSVPDDKMPEFIAWWKEVASEEIEVNVEPIPIDLLDNISYAEFQTLAELVAG